MQKLTQNQRRSECFSKPKASNANLYKFHSKKHPKEVKQVDYAFVLFTYLLSLGKKDVLGFLPHPPL